MATIYIENKPYQISEGQNLLEASLNLGFNLPYFCWHPALGSVGACRQCAVKQFKDENDAQGSLIMACMTPAKDGSHISIGDPQAAEFRATVIEWLMANHPHDCPVCDEGGECHLQDMTVMSGHTYRNHRFPKRTYRNQDLGPFITHEMNRCITCYRCVRFYKDYAGGRDFDAFGARDHVYFGRFEDGPFENEFSGNLVEICPTGVFTDKTLHEHYTRKWDLQTAPSVCTLCSAGCNIIPGERYGMLRRIRNRYHPEVNGYFLCDRGRYGYEFVNSERRVRQAVRRLEKGARAEAITPAQAVESLAESLSSPERVIGIGSPHASLEDNFALRSLVGADHFSTGMPAQQAAALALAVEVLRDGPARSPSIHDIEQADAVLVLGEDVTNLAPRLALALRQSVRQKPMQDLDKLNIPPWQDAAVREAVQDKKGPLFIATPYATRLDDVALLSLQAAPEDLARFGFAIAHVLDPESPAVEDFPEKQAPLAAAIAADLQEAKHPLIIAGVTLGSLPMIQAAANVAYALCDQERTASLCYLAPEANAMGLALLGGMDLETALQAVQQGQADRLILLENDVTGGMLATPIQDLLAASQVVVLDSLESGLSGLADLLLPTATFAECSGTLVNYEGRAQRFFQVFEPEGDVRAAWQWLGAARQQAGLGQDWQDLSAVMRALVEAEPQFAPILSSAPLADFRVLGMKIPRQSPRYSGRTSIHADQEVNVPVPPMDPDSPLAFSMEGFEGQPPAALIPRYWAPGWNSVQALNRFQQEVGGELRNGNPGARLIEPPASPRRAYFEDVPSAFRRQPDEWLLVPIYHIFGSEPLSMLTPGIAALAPQTYLALNPLDADDLGLAEGQTVVLDGGLSLPVKQLVSLPQGVAGLPVGLVGNWENCGYVHLQSGEREIEVSQ